MARPRALRMAKKNLPHIPIYIGDWDKDCNCLSLEAEMAWMKIIFKMFTNGKQSTYKVPTKALQNLWKSSAEKVQEIITELTLNNITNITITDDIVEFVSRRYEKENVLSEIRSKAVSKRYVDTKPVQKVYKKLHNADNDNNNSSLNVLKNIEKEKLSYIKNWLKYRKSIKKPITNESTLRVLVKRFNAEPTEKIEWVVNSSIENGYQGLFWDNYKVNSNNPIHDPYDPKIPQL